MRRGLNRPAPQHPTNTPITNKTRGNRKKHGAKARTNFKLGIIPAWNEPWADVDPRLQRFHQGVHDGNQASGFGCMISYVSHTPPPQPQLPRLPHPLTQPSTPTPNTPQTHKQDDEEKALNARGICSYEQLISFYATGACTCLLVLVVCTSPSPTPSATTPSITPLKQPHDISPYKPTQYRPRARVQAHDAWLHGLEIPLSAAPVPGP